MSGHQIRSAAIKLELEYGTSVQTIKIDDARIKQVVEPGSAPQVENLSPAVDQSLNKPIGAPPLSKAAADKSRVLILTVDRTRPSPVDLLWPVLDTIQPMGIGVTICVALGRHRRMTGDELIEHFGMDMIDRCKLLQHDAFDDQHHTDLGATSRGTPIKVNEVIAEHDFIIGVGFVEPSYLAGFSGGRKLIMPGIAHHTSIDANHYLLLEKGAEIGRLEGNPIHEDAMEFVGKAPLDWLTCGVLGGKDEITAVLSGDPVKAHAEACEISRKIYEKEAEEADIVISTVGGHPYDCDLVQAKKGIIPATKIVRKGGVIILLGECPDLWGAEETFQEWVTRKPPEQVVTDVNDREKFNLGAHGANILAKPVVEKQATVILVTSRKMGKELRDSYVQPARSLSAALSQAEGVAGSDASVSVVRCARRMIVR
ncbi:MAG: nickel-dependent lactate racemase [Planctomycetes bacterium]|nr:nickel-dependent lactate racemase [Planctomycetota bacterium]